jgi:VIT1/CCC1 family predicted Fe2+/Mn2+ transporter
VAADFGALDRIRSLMAAATLIVIGAQLFFSGFMMSVLSGNKSKHSALT